jgi:hypothetical protein
MGIVILSGCDSFEFCNFGMSQINDLQTPKRQKSNKITSSEERPLGRVSKDGCTHCV